MLLGLNGLLNLQHQREKSVDLLNQPDMLAALLGPSQAEDDWASPAAYHTHTRHASRHDDFDLPAMVGDNIDGDMVIPEPVPYTEPEPEPYYDDEPEQLPTPAYNGYNEVRKRPLLVDAAYIRLNNFYILDFNILDPIHPRWFPQP